MRAVIPTLFLFLLSACGSGSGPDKSALPGEDVVLARVGESTITLYELHTVAERTLGEDIARTLDAAGRRKVLESLVQSRAVAQLSEKELSGEDRAALDKRVAAYREELLVQRYIDRHVTPTPVTAQMVQAYYDQHPERFGAKRVVSYEMVQSNAQPQGKQREQLLQALRDPGQHRDWRAFAAALQSQGHDVVFRSGDVSEQLLDPQLRSVVSGLRPGESSNVVMLAGRLHVLRVADDRLQDGRSLSEVQEEIRRTLSPQQVKKAVKQVSKQALEKVEVAYQNAERLNGS